ncbi:MAG: DUF1178 family protein [Robiginitomaculum sp.]
MIKYTLQCEHEHDFEVWFGHSNDYDKQVKEKQISCPHCASTMITKAPMAPNIVRGGGTDMDKIADKVRNYIAKTCDDVGTDFTEEGRAMHYGEKPQRGIYGSASPKQVLDLLNDGIDIVPLPPTLVPKPKKKLN